MVTKKTKRTTRMRRFIRDIALHTPFINLLLLLIVLWLLFSAGICLFESEQPQSAISSYGNALYWGVAAFSTAGIADTPVSAQAKLLGALWIVIGSTLFFGAIVATVTSYFMRPLQRPHKRIIETIEYNLEQLNELTIEELDLLKDTVDALIVHVESIKQKQQS